MKNFIVAAALVAAAASVANARDDEPSREAVEEFAGRLHEASKAQGISLREEANHLASSIWWSEKLQLFCSSYFYVNARKARYDYLLRLGTWNTFFGAGKTATSILNEAAARRNEEFSHSFPKDRWCDSVKAFGIEHFGWAPLFEVGD
jgi:hypothetical protein